MKKYSNVFIAMVLLLLSSVYSFSSQYAQSVFNSDRYNIILKLYNAGTMTSDTTALSDIAIVAEHKKILEQKLPSLVARQQFIGNIFNTAAFTGGLVSVVSAFGLSNTLKSYEGSVGPTAANTLWLVGTLASLISAGIAQFVYKSSMVQDLRSQIAYDTEIIKDLQKLWLQQV